MTLTEAKRFRVFGDRVLVARLPLADQHKSGLYILGRDYPTMGEVLRIGNGRRVIKGPYRGWRIEPDGPNNFEILHGQLVHWHVSLSDYDLKLVGPDLLLLDYSDLNWCMDWPAALRRPSLG